VIVGLAGYAGSGKNAAAEILVKAGFRQVAFADPIRRIAETVNPVIGVRLSRPVHYQDAVAKYGYDEAKRIYPLLRDFLQRLGTEGGRQVLGQNVWVDLTLAGVDDDEDVVITDVRFANEALAILNRGGHVIRVTRPGVGPVNDHPSERALDGMLLPEVGNDGSLEDLRAGLWRTLAGLRRKA
jgi:hypothetical protein